MKIYRDCDATTLATFRIPAKVSCLAEYATVGELEAILSDPSLLRPFFHIGEGSNILFTGKFKGTVLRSVNKEISFCKDGKVRTSAAASLDSLTEEVAKKGLWGLENLSGIPGTVGAAIAGNAGAYGAETCQRLCSVTCYDAQEKCTVTFDAADLQFGYRFSSFKSPEFKDRYYITEATFNVSVQGEPDLDYGNLREKVGEDGNVTPLLVRKAVLDTRAAKLPDLERWGCAGSFFKNSVISQEEFEQLCKKVQQDESVTRKDVPHYELEGGLVKVPAAYLIEQSGLKEATCGAAFLWPRQPLVLSVDPQKNPRPEDVTGLDATVREAVYKKFNIQLEREVIYL